MKKFLYAALLLTVPFLFCGCTGVGDKSMNVAAIYTVTAVLAVVMLIGYFSLIRKKEGWLVLCLHQP